MKTLALRTLTALVGLIVLIGAVRFGVPWITVLVLLAAVLGLREFYRLCPAENLTVTPANIAEESTSSSTSRSISSSPLGETPDKPAALPLALGALWVIALVLGGQAATGPAHFWVISLVVFAAGAFISLLWLIAFYRGRKPGLTAAYLIGGPVYLGFLLAHALTLAEVGDIGPVYELGRNWLLFALLVTFATDTGAYLSGRAIGKHKMAPTVSPNKTWEGAVGGFIGAVIAALILDQFLNLGLARWQPPLIGATVGIVAQVGDLFESRLKRLSQVKDTGSIIPGHGGILDRLDSLLVTIPTVYYFLIVVFKPVGAMFKP